MNRSLLLGLLLFPAILLAESTFAYKDVGEGRELGAASFEPSTDRMGSDFNGFEMRDADPVLCQQACESDARCRAWTYVHPNTIQGPAPRCWLKGAIPAPRTSNCCVSGVIMARRGMEWDTDRMGQDYDSLELPSADPALCRQACDGDARCRSWTYVHPDSIQGPIPLCWLKGGVPAPVDRNCCVSGVK